MDNDASAGDHDPAPTRSCRPRQKTTPNSNGPARSHPTILPTSSLRLKSGKHLEFCMTLCAWQHERGALYIMILTDSEECIFRGTVFGTKGAAPWRGECLAWTGFTTNGDWGKVGLQPSCHEPCSRVDQIIHGGRTHSTRSDCQRRTVAERRAFPFAANCDAMQFAQRLRDTADEELVTPLENFVAAAYREPDLAEETCFAQTRLRKLKWMRKSHRPHSNDYC